MKTTTPQIENSNSKVHLFFLAFFTLATFLFQISNFYGEDIVNARENFLTGARTDFWGGASTLFYSTVPDFGFRWQIWLAIFQVLITTVGLRIMFFRNNKTKYPRPLTLAVTYFALLIGSQMTRDGLMFSLLVLGYALFQEGIHKARTKNIIFSIFVLSLAFSLRPWLSVSILPIIIFILKLGKDSLGRFKATLICSAIVMAPFLVDLTAAKALDLNRSYPQQQVILMDAAAGYCYSNNFETGKNTEKILSSFYSTENFSSQICQMFRPDTWESLFHSENVSARGTESNFMLLKPGQETKYRNLKSEWLRMIVNDPITYLQNRILFAGKLMIGSDTRNISIINVKGFPATLTALYKLPYEIGISLHLFSILALLFYLTLGAVRVSKARMRTQIEGLTLDRLSTLLIISVILWSIASSVAYIGSNGRYTYSITLLALIIHTSHSTRAGNSNA